MVQAILKNTFISLRIETTDEAHDLTPSCLRSSPSLQPRSRSLESVRHRPEAEEFQEQSRQSMQRINTLLSRGMPSPPQAPRKAIKHGGDGSMLDQPAKLTEPIECPSSSGVLSELQSLKEKLAFALARPSSDQQKPWDKHLRDLSNCSLSTMAPDDARECCERRSTGIASPFLMSREWSSGSVSTLWSELNDLEDEDEDEVEFDLDIEKGAAAALEDKDALSVAPIEDNSCGAVAGLEWPAARMQSCGLWLDAAAGLKAAVALGAMSHSQVPKKHNMEEVYNSTKDDAPTTMMIRNIPGRYSPNDLMMDLKESGLEGTYDFLYLPVDKGTSSNVGYAFVNFTEPSWAMKCKQSFEYYRFSRHKRSSGKGKLGRVSVAHLQGLEKNLRHYQNAAVNMCKEKQRRPVVVASIANMFG